MAIAIKSIPVLRDKPAQVFTSAVALNTAKKYYNTNIIKLE